MRTRTHAEHEATGILLVVAKVDPNNTGTIEREELATFEHEVKMLVEGALGFASTALVVATLCLAATPQLMLWPHSERDASIASIGGDWPALVDFNSGWSLSAKALPIISWFETAAFALLCGFHYVLWVRLLCQPYSLLPRFKIH